jgi:hypothetical protein
MFTPNMNSKVFPLSFISILTLFNYCDRDTLPRHYSIISYGFLIFFFLNFLTRSRLLNGYFVNRGENPIKKYHVMALIHYFRSEINLVIHTVLYAE